MSGRRITLSTLGAMTALAVGVVAFSPFSSSVSTVAAPVSASAMPTIPDVSGVPVADPTPAPAPAPAAPAEAAPAADPAPAPPPAAAPAPVRKAAPAPAPPSYPVAAPAAPPAPTPPAPSNGQEIGGQAGLSEVNNFRAANGLPALAWFDATYPKAIGWSHHLADVGALSHSTLSDGVPGGWSTLGENVAWNTSLAAAFTALENSPAHRANLLDARFTRVSIGVVLQDGKYWVTQEFYG